MLLRGLHSLSLWNKSVHPCWKVRTSLCSLLRLCLASSLGESIRNSAQPPANKMLWHALTLIIYHKHVLPQAFFHILNSYHSLNIFIPYIPGSSVIWRKERKPTENTGQNSNILCLPGWPHFLQICCRDLSEVFVQSLECNRERVLWLLQHNSTATEHVRRLEDVS